MAGSSLLDHPMEFICDLKDSAAIVIERAGVERKGGEWGGCRFAWMTSSRELLSPDAGGDGSFKPDCLLNSGWAQVCMRPPVVFLLYLFAEK